MGSEKTTLLAQANIARLKYPLSDTRMAGMSDRIDEMNALAEHAPGFVWRFEPDGCPDNQLDCFREYLQPFDEARFFFNLSVWASAESLRDYVFRTRHAEMLRDRDQWVERIEVPSLVMWPVAVGERPTAADALARFQSLRANGNTEGAFGFG